MLSLLEPYAGQRHRAARLILLSGCVRRDVLLRCRAGHRTVVIGRLQGPGPRAPAPGRVPTGPTRSAPPRARDPCVAPDPYAVAEFVVPRPPRVPDDRPETTERSPMRERAPISESVMTAPGSMTAPASSVLPEIRAPSRRTLPRRPPCRPSASRPWPPRPSAGSGGRRSGRARRATGPARGPGPTTADEGRRVPRSSQYVESTMPCRWHRRPGGPGRSPVRPRPAALRNGVDHRAAEHVCPGVDLIGDDLLRGLRLLRTPSPFPCRPWGPGRRPSGRHLREVQGHIGARRPVGWTRARMSRP